jgi:hypothetical protein
VHDHGQSTRQGHNRLFQAAVSGDLHRPDLEPGPFCRTRSPALVAIQKERSRARAGPLVGLGSDTRPKFAA